MQVRFNATTTISITLLALLGCSGSGGYDFDGDGHDDSVDCAPEDDTPVIRRIG